jgi:hypothetical protein
MLEPPLEAAEEVYEEYFLNSGGSRNTHVLNVKWEEVGK